MKTIPFIYISLFICFLSVQGCKSSPVEPPEKNPTETPDDSDPVDGEDDDDGEEAEEPQEEEEETPTFDNSMAIQPYSENARYWQFEGKPVLLLGGTDNDNLFQSANMEEQLDLLHSVGGNYIRNTMSSRDENDIWPFLKLENGLYDLNQWNEEYWNRFEKLLELCEERDIIVQIEIWDRFDFSREPWELNPFNPKNNINYSDQESGLSISYPGHPAGDLQPFFHAIAGLPRYNDHLDTVESYQQKYVDKMLSFSLQHGNVLYCVNNETNTPPEWGRYWISYIKQKAAGSTIYITDMFDLFYSPQLCEVCQEAISLPNEYQFLDASQVNSRNAVETHWDTLRWVMEERDNFDLRPINSVKVYGVLGSSRNDGVERFCRDVIGGFAAVRHHRPESGNGLNDAAIASIKAIRKVEKYVSFWNLELNMNILSERSSNEAFLAAQSGESYVLYFPKKGDVKLDFSSYNKTFYGHWISVSTGEWGQNFTLEGGSLQEVKTPDNTGWFAVITNEQD